LFFLEKVKFEKIKNKFHIYNFSVRLLLLYTIIYEQFILIISIFTFYKKKKKNKAKVNVPIIDSVPIYDNL